MNELQQFEQLRTAYPFRPGLQRLDKALEAARQQARTYGASAWAQMIAGARALAEQCPDEEDRKFNPHLHTFCAERIYLEALNMKAPERVTLAQLIRQREAQQ